MKKAAILFITLAISTLADAQGKKDEGFRFVPQPDKKQLDILYNGKLLTSYCYYDSVMKPVLFPINTVSGVAVTRGYPLAPRPGERVDHPHHIGLWLNYEYVNGLDFWNNSTAISYDQRSHYGTIYHDRIVKTEANKNNATLEVSAQWKRPDKITLLVEATKYTFRVSGNDFIIDRTTSLRTLQEDVSMKDVKDGFLGFRVARELELPSTDKVALVDATGNASKEPVQSNEGVSGSYLSSEGLKDNDVWGTRGRWVQLSGLKDGKQVSVSIFDHPQNVGYPAYWHARGYGLFAVNPLGQEIFSKGKEKLNFGLKKGGEEVTFRYRVMIHEGSALAAGDLNKVATDFAKVR